MVKVTEKEMEFLKEISTSDFAVEGWCDVEDGGVGDWVGSDGKVNLPTDQYNMKVVRGLMSSLEQKGVIELRGTEIGNSGQPITWVNVSVELDAEPIALPDTVQPITTASCGRIANS